MTFCVLFTLINSWLHQKNHKNFHQQALLQPILPRSFLALPCNMFCCSP
jgi:hypothetical protein